MTKLSLQLLGDSSAVTLMKAYALALSVAALPYGTHGTAFGGQQKGDDQTDSDMKDLSTFDRL